MRPGRAVLLLILISGRSWAADTALATAAATGDADSLVECTVVRAYPDKDGQPNPATRDHTYQIDDTVNLDVRGLGTWFRKLTDLGVASKTVQGIIGKNQAQTTDYSQWICAVRASAKTLCLYINGKPFNDLVPLAVNPQWDEKDQFDSTKCPLMTLRFLLHRNPTDGEAGTSTVPYRPWNLITTSLYSQMRGKWQAFEEDGAPANLTVGIPDPTGIGVYYVSSALNPDDASDNNAYVVKLIPYSVPWMMASVGAIVILVYFCIYLGITTDLLRDTTLPRNPTGSFPFSLGLCQMAFWTVVVTGSYLFIWCSTSNYNTFNSTALILLGISSATGLSASLISNSNMTRQVSSSLTPAELAQQNVNELVKLRDEGIKTLNGLPADDSGIVAASERVRELNYRIRYLQKPLSRFLFDLISERNYITFHRFQLVVWTLILAIIFVCAVWANLDMPIFDTSILFLMGISSGSYIGFKWPTPTSAGA